MAPRQWALGQTQVDDLLSGGSRYVPSEPGELGEAQWGELIAAEAGESALPKSRWPFWRLCPHNPQVAPYSVAAGIFLSWNPRSIIAYVSRTRMWVATSFSVRPNLPRPARRTR